MSKTDGPDNKPPLTAEQQKKADAVVAFQAEWARVGKDITEGKLSTEQLKQTAETLLKHRRDASVDADTAVKNIIKDCKAAKISDVDLHKFVGAAIAAEFEIEKKDPVNEGLMRFSSKSVAKALMDYEMDKMGFKAISLDMAKRGTDKEVIDALIDVKIPPFLKDHYTPIVKHYQALDEEDRKNEQPNTMRVQRAYTNLVFSTVTSPLSAKNMEKYNQVKVKLGDKHPDSEKERVEMARIQTKISQLTAIAYPGPTKQASAPDKAVMYDALAQQFNPDPAKQQLGPQEIQKLKDKAYARGGIQKESIQQDTSLATSQSSKKVRPAQKETKDKTFAQRFDEVKQRLSRQRDTTFSKIDSKGQAALKDLKEGKTKLIETFKSQTQGVSKTISREKDKLVAGIKKEANATVKEATEIKGEVQRAASIAGKLAHDMKVALETRNTSHPASPVMKRAADTAQKKGKFGGHGGGMSH